MTARRIILACFLGLISAQSARAETACGTLSHMIESLSLVSEIQTDPGGPAYKTNLDRLDAVTTRISLPDLIPLDPSASRATERDALIRYVSGLREAVSSAASGHDLYAQQRLDTIVTPAVFAGLSSMETHWDCGSEEDTQQLDIDGQTDANAFSGSDGGDAENGPNRTANPTDSKADSRPRQTNVSEQTGTSFSRDAVVTGNMMAFFFMLGFMALIAAFFYAQSSAQKKTVRESRRALNAPVDVKLDGTDHRMRLVDISMNGFKLRHSGQIDTQETLSVSIGGAWHVGHVRWANPHYAGIKFKRAIDPETLSIVMGPTSTLPTLDAAA